MNHNLIFNNLLKHINMNNKLKIFIFFLIGIAVYSCKKNKLQDFESVYLTAAEKSTTTTLSADDSGGAFAISATSSQLVQNDVKVEIAADPALIEKYNTLTGKKYSTLPEGSYSLESNSVTITKGTNISNKINFKVLSIKDFKAGVSYVMPITIRSSNGPAILDASSTLYIVVNKVIISSVAALTSNYFTVDFSKSNLTALTSLTMETKVMVNKFQTVSPFISTLMGIEENFLFRFGDVTVANNQLQISGGATATNVPMAFSPGIWYHIAAVYNGSSLLVYVNGQLVASKDGVPRTINLTESYGGGFHFGYSTPGRPIDGYISEAKVWSKALSQSEISNGICGVDPKSAGLIAYWKFNEGTGDTATDISGNGYNAVANRAVTWLPNVRCN